jgi:hypothetical protein
MKDGYAAETDARREAENTIYRLKSQVSFYQQASLSKSSEQVVQSTKEDIEELEECKTNLELVCHHLRMERDELVTELNLHSKNIEKLLASQKPKELHWERLQQAYQQQLDSMSRDMEVARINYAKMVKTREEIISDMILLNTKNAELSQLNNDLSRRVMEREQEAKAFFSGTNFLSPPQENDELKPSFSATNTIQSTGNAAGKHHRRNLSTGSIGMTSSTSVDIKATMDSFAASTQKLAQRDSFNGSAAPKLFKFRRNRSNSGKRPKVSLDALDQKETENTTVRKSGSHHFAQAKFIRPTKCEACGEKMWRVSELKCSGNSYKIR